MKPKLNTDGIDPKIIKGILTGNPVKCRVWNSGNKKNWFERYVIWVKTLESRKFLCIDNSGNVRGLYSYAEPIETETRVKSAKEILKWAIENDAEIEMAENRIRYIVKEGFKPFAGNMFNYCGKKPASKWEWEPEWLEEKIIDN